MEIPDSIVISKDLSAKVGQFIEGKKYSEIAVLVDENTQRDCYPVISENLPDHHLIEIKSGESNKNIKTCITIWEEMTRHTFDRNALVINLGGGVIGDMGGFCASTYKRGIDFINIPTTLLAQVDASIGGKLGIDFQGLKNHIGMFREPEKIFIYTSFLKTLSRRELRSGFAEVIKHSLIADEAMFREIKEIKLDQLNWERIIPHSVKVKYGIILKDPEENGLRKILNFGHTVGHAIESFYLDQPGKRLLHGEAIAVGMICESWLSTTTTGLPEKALDSISSYLKGIYHPQRIPQQDIEGIIALANQDKKNNKGIIRCALLQQTGLCTYDITVTSTEIREAIHYYNDQLEQN